MACSRVMHSNSARLVVTLSLPRAGRWRWPAVPAAESAAALGLAAACGPPSAGCPLQAPGPAGRRLALCGQAAAGIPLPNYRHSVAAAGAGRLTEHRRRTAVRVTHLASAAFNHSPRARTPAHPSVCQRTRQSAHPPASQPATVVSAAVSRSAPGPGLPGRVGFRAGPGRRLRPACGLPTAAVGWPPPCPVRAGDGRRHSAAQLPALSRGAGGRPPDCRQSHSLSLSGAGSGLGPCLAETRVAGHMPWHGSYGMDTIMTGIISRNYYVNTVLSM